MVDDNSRRIAMERALRAGVTITNMPGPHEETDVPVTTISASAVNVVLISGDRHRIEKVMLYEAKAVSELQSLRQQASKLFAGVSTGLGFWGSPGWVIGGALVLGALESLASRSNAKKGYEILVQVENLAKK